MEFERKTCSSFPQYTSDWDILNDGTQKLAILQSEFIISLQKHFFSGNEFLLIGKQAGQIVSMLFLQKAGFGRWQTVMPSQAPLCLWVGTKHELTEELLKSIAKALPGPVLQLDFLQVDTDELVASDKFDEMHYIQTGNLQIPESFEQYFKSLGKNLRQNYNKVVNRAARAEDKLNAYFVSEPEKVLEAVIKYGEIESNSWKAEMGTSISPDNEQGLFYQELLESFAKQGKGVCWYYTVNDQIAVVDICVIKDSTIIILKTTFDESYAKYSPALQLKVDMIRHYSENPELGIDNMEFFGKAMEWHKRLHSRLRDINHYTGYPVKAVKTLKSLIVR